MSKFEPRPDLPRVRRVVTGHDGQANAVFDREDSLTPVSIVKAANAGISVGFSLIHRTTNFPVLPQGDEREFAVESLQRHEGQTGVVCEVVDVPPRSSNEPLFMHRNSSLDYGVVMEGEIVLVLDQGVEKTLRQGDIFVQRGTMHAWKNVSGANCRFMTVVIPSQPVWNQSTGERLSKSTIPGLSN